MKSNKRKILWYIFISLVAYSWIKQQFGVDNLIRVSSEKSELNFVVLGDWGTRGKFQQQEVADRINDLTIQEKLDFIATAGDNFYPRGVESIEDTHWKESYSHIYKGNVLNIPWYPVLGNHDYQGNIAAQFEYSEHSKSWTFPGKYYALEQKYGNDKTALIVFLDTNPFYEPYYLEDRYANIEAQDSLIQINWMNELFEKSRADWKIVIGHHPLYTGGMRAKEPPYVRKHLEKLFQEHQVDAYFAGHEHDLQHLSPPGDIEYFVSGSGARARPTGEIDHTEFSASSPGFIWVNLRGESMQVKIIDDQGLILYDTEVGKKEKNCCFW